MIFLIVDHPSRSSLNFTVYEEIRKVRYCDGSGDLIVSYQEILVTNLSTYRIYLHNQFQALRIHIRILRSNISQYVYKPCTGYPISIKFIIRHGEEHLLLWLRHKTCT